MDNKESFTSSVFESIKGSTGSLIGKILFVILIISLTANVFQFYAKGIYIDRSDRSDRSDRRVSHQEQMQGQLFIQNSFVQGDHVTWTFKTFTYEYTINKSYDENIQAAFIPVNDYLTSLHPTSSYMSECIPIVSGNGAKITIVVKTPSIISLNKGTTK